MVVSRQRAYYRAVRRAVTLVDSDTALKQVLHALIRTTARAMEGGASLLLVDSTKKKLIHHSSWGLAKAYLQKGVLDAHRSLAEVVTGQQ